MAEAESQVSVVAAVFFYVVSVVMLVNGVLTAQRHALGRAALGVVITFVVGLVGVMLRQRWRALNDAAP